MCIAHRSLRNLCSLITATRSSRAAHGKRTRKDSLRTAHGASCNAHCALLTVTSSTRIAQTSLLTAQRSLPTA
eukprot:9551893-Lingulodinium_polyedra.AAC.1